MDDLKKELINKNNKRMEEVEKEIGLAEAEVRKLKAELKIENMLLRDENEKRAGDADRKEIAEQIEAGVVALESILVMEQNRLKDLANEQKISELRKTILEKELPN